MKLKMRSDEQITRDSRAMHHRTRTLIALEAALRNDDVQGMVAGILELRQLIAQTHALSEARIAQEVKNTVQGAVRECLSLMCAGPYDGEYGLLVPEGAEEMGTFSSPGELVIRANEVGDSNCYVFENAVKGTWTAHQVTDASGRVVETIVTGRHAAKTGRWGTRVYEIRVCTDAGGLLGQGDYAVYVHHNRFGQLNAAKFVLMEDASTVVKAAASPMAVPSIEKKAA